MVHVIIAIVEQPTGQVVMSRQTVPADKESILAPTKHELQIAYRVDRLLGDPANYVDKNTKGQKQ